MKRFLIPLACAVVLAAVIVPRRSRADAAPGPGITIAIAAPAFGPGDDRPREIPVNSKSHFHVVITNVSDKIQRVEMEGSSDGDEALSFEITDENGKKTIVHRAMMEYGKNMLHWWVLQPGECVVTDVDVMGNEWQPGFPHPDHYGASETVTMSAIFEFKTGAYAEKEGLWTGRVTSKPEKYTFWNNGD
ncbi:MAG TPA: hypothetical protein VG733_08795 [Chthoniobacteraceae bacterium]|nr:hypothetical protein [Chthoniobacteraceae bacterium]